MAIIEFEFPRPEQNLAFFARRRSRGRTSKSLDNASSSFTPPKGPEDEFRSKRRVALITSGLILGSLAVTLARPWEWFNIQPDSSKPETEILNPLFQPAVNQAEMLSAKFPSEFADAKLLKDDLLRLQKSGDLLIRVVDPIILGTVRPQLTVENGLISGLKAQVYINPYIISLSPTEQVLLLTHEISHHKDQTDILQSLLQNLKGKPNSPENISVVEQTITRLTFQMESKELFKNCRQLFALKSENPNFTTRVPIPFEQPLPNSLNRTETLYSVYLQVKNVPNPEHDPRWKAAIALLLNFFMVNKVDR